MNRNTAWVVPFVVGLGAGACGQRARPSPLESPLGEIQTAGAPAITVRISEAGRSDNFEQIDDIAILDNDLYVSVQNSGIYRLPKYGGGITAVNEATGADFAELAVGDGVVFWEEFTFGSSDFPTIHLRSVATGDTAVSTIHQEAIGGIESSRGKNLQVDGSLVYLTEIVNATDSGAVHRIPTSGGAELSSLMPFTLPGAGYISATDPPRAWIARNGGVFYADCPLYSGSCAIRRETADGLQTIISFPGKEAYVHAVDEASIYVSNVIFEPGPPFSQTVPLLKIDQQTGEITQLTPDCGGVAMMVDGGQELFFASGFTAIKAISKQGGAQRTLADMTGTQGVSRIAQDDTFLFALTSHTEVVAIPKGTPAQP